MPQFSKPNARHSSKELGRRLARRVGLSLLAVTIFVVSAAGFAWHNIQSRIAWFNIDSLLTEEDRRAETEGEDMGAGSEIAKAASAPKAEGRIALLDEMQIRLLRLLLQGKPVKALIAAQRGMPEVVADELNEALFDEIGDNVVECDDGVLVLVEDYRRDVSRILGGSTE